MEAGEEAEEAEEAEEGVQSGAELLAARADAFATEPIYRLPALAISWARPRSDAKALVGWHVQTGRAHSSPLWPTPLARPDPRRRVAKAVCAHPGCLGQP